MTRFIAFAATAGVSLIAFTAAANIQLYNTVDGSPLDLSFAIEEGRDTPAAKTFMQAGTNVYNEDKAILPEGEELYLTACSGCHGHYGEGKIGPGLNDAYWTYPKNETDQGLFETIFGGAQGQMGPQYGSLTIDEMLKSMAWIRHLYVGDPKDATWLTAEQRAAFKPYEQPAARPRKP